MSKKIKVLALILTGLFIILITAVGVYAVTGKKDLFSQLVIVSKRAQIVKLDIDKNKIEVTDPGNKRTLYYLEVDGNTNTSHNGKKIHWTQLKPGQLIDVKGCIGLDGSIKAKEIAIVK